MERLNGKTKGMLRDVAVIIGGLAGAFAFFLFVVGVIVGLPVVELVFVLIGIGMGAS